MARLLNPSLLLILVLLLSLFFGRVLPYSVKSLLYALSLTIKELLVFVLPFIIFALVFNSIGNLKGKALKFITLILPAICLSNLISALLAYSIGSGIMRTTSLALIKIPHDTVSPNLSPIWILNLPHIISNSTALLLGAISAILLSYLKPAKLTQISEKIVKISLFILEKIFLPIIPLFVFGFALKMQHDKILSLVFQNYLLIFIIITLVTYTYIFFLYGVANSFSLKPLITSIDNMIPAAITAFSTMSSLAALPITLSAGEKNTKKSTITQAVIPTTVNIHLIGDCFFIIIFAVSIMLSFGQTELGLNNYTNFFFYFVLAKLASAAVPGAGIIVMLPVLEQYLYFSPIMLSLITTLYIIFDPVITSANVMGNGAFLLIFSKLYKKFFK